MIEIIFMLIPIFAILAFSPIGKAIAQAILVNSVALEAEQGKFFELEKRLKEQEEELNKLREIVVFNDEIYKKDIKTFESSIKNISKRNSIDIEKKI